MSSKNNGFAYSKTPERFVAEFRDGKWSQGAMSSDENIVLNESACVLQYAQTCFEGLKAYRTADKKAVLFRPDLNEARFKDSCTRMMIPPLADGVLVDAVKKTAKANIDYIPSYEDGGSLYLRPFAFGKDAVMGVKPASEYEFRVFASPVGAYFGDGFKALKLRVSDFDRAAPHGTGNIKAGLNYAMSLYAISDAHEKGFDENVYLDSSTRTYIDETGGANIIFITKDGELVTPKSDTILPSVTRRSLVYVAEKYLGIKAQERPVKLEELSEFDECGLCGTAAVISAVGSIDDHGKVYKFRTKQDKSDSVIDRLLHTLLDIQHGIIEAPEGWIVEI